MKFTAKRADNDEWVTGYYVKTTAAKLGLYDVPLAIARICNVIVVDGEFFHIDPETLKFADDEEINPDIKIYCGICDDLIQESIGESIKLNSGLFETAVVYPHKCKATFEFHKESINILKDGDMWCARFGDFINLQESIAGFGGTYVEALSNLLLEKMKLIGSPQ